MQKMTPEQLIEIENLLKQAEVRIKDQLLELVKNVETMSSETLKLSDLYDLLPEDEVNYLKRTLGK